VGESPAVKGYAFIDGEEEHRFLFSGAAKAWVLEDWSSDSDFVYWGCDRKRDSGLLIVCGGTQLSFAGQKLVASSKRISFCEVVCENGSVQISAPQRSALTVSDAALRSLTTQLMLSAVGQSVNV
jgi:hypothetical protein